MMKRFESAANFLQNHDVRELSPEEFSNMSELLVHELSFISLKKIWKHPSNPLQLETKNQIKSNDKIIWACGHNVGRYVTLELLEAAYVKSEQGPYNATTDEWAQAATDDYIDNFTDYRRRRRYGNLGSELAEKADEIIHIGAHAIVDSGELHLPTALTYRLGYMTISAIPALEKVEALRNDSYLR